MPASENGPVPGRAARPSAVRRAEVALLAIFAVLAASAAMAQTTPGQPFAREIEFEKEKVDTQILSLSLGGIQSDNVSRVPTNEESGSVAISSLNLKYRENTRRIHADVDADIGYEHFLDETFDDGVIGQADGVVTVDLLPERVEWFLEDHFRQARVDPFGADTPENRQNVNRFATGPDVRLHLNDTMAMRFSSRFARVDYETAAADGDRVSGSIAVVRQLGTARAASFNVSRESINFDDDANVGYDRDSTFVRYEARNSRTELTADLGYMRIQDDLGKTANGALLDVLLLRRVSPDSRLALNLGTRFSDSGDIVRLTPGTDRENVDPVVVLSNAQPFEGRFVNLGWEFGRNRTGLGAFVEYRQQRYTDAPEFDRDLVIYGAHVNRSLSPRIEVYARVHNSREEFDNGGGYNKELLGNLGVLLRLGISSHIALDGQHMDRKSTNLLSEFTENRLSLFFVWTPVSRGRQ